MADYYYNVGECIVDIFAIRYWKIVVTFSRS